MAASLLDPDDRERACSTGNEGIEAGGEEPAPNPEPSSGAAVGASSEPSGAGISTEATPTPAPPEPGVDRDGDGACPEPRRAVELPPTILLEPGAFSVAGAESLGFATFLQKPQSGLELDQDGDAAGGPTFHYRGCVTPGTIIDGYEVLAMVGRGGMGEVYRARHRMTAMGQVVALKLLRRSIWDAEARTCDAMRQVARFYVELRAASMIHDEHVVPVLNAGLHEGFPYYVMMFVDGDSLAQQLRSGPMSPVQAVGLIGPIVRAVEHAHSKGVIHRDIKPSNILIDEAGKPYLTDFGLAKLFEHNPTMALTSKDVLMGTPQYIPPEQVRDASRADARSDVYSLGATLYEMLTGIPPFQGADPMGVVLRVLNEPATPPQRLNPVVPDELDRICVRCLEKDPTRRFRSAGELAAELSRFVQGVPIETQPPTFLETAAQWVRARPLISALMLAIVASVLIGLISTTIQLRRARDALGKLEYQAYLNHLALASAALDAGRALDARDQLLECPPTYRNWEWRFLDRLRHHRPPLLGGYPGTIYGLAFRPGGVKLVAGGRHGAPWIWDASKSRRIGELAGLPAGATVYDLAWSRSADGVERIAATCNDGCLRIWTRKGDAWGTPRELRGHRGGVDALTVSRDGLRVATGGDDGRLLVWDATGGSDRPLFTLVEAGPAILALAFSPEADRLVSVGEEQPPRSWSLSSGRATPLPKSGQSEQISLAVAVSRSGRYTAVGDDDGVLTLWDARAPDAPRRLKGGFDSINSVVFSPDETRLLSADSDGTVTFWDVASREKVFSRHGHNEAVDVLAFRDDGLILASAGRDGAVRIWDARPWGRADSLGEARAQP